MYRTSGRLAFFVFACCAAMVSGQVTSAFAQADQAQPRVEPRLAIAVNVFCSQEKLGTSSARIQWSLPNAALIDSGLNSLAAATQKLETTVYKNGFEKGMLISFPISQAATDRPIASQASAKQQTQRAFQIRLVRVGQPKETPSPDSAGEMSALVENLEPGMNYTWRIAIDTPSGGIVSTSVTSQAEVCPVDMVPSTAVPPRRKR